MNKNTLGIIWIGIALMTIAVGSWSYVHQTKKTRSTSLNTRGVAFTTQTAAGLATPTQLSNSVPNATSTPLTGYPVSGSGYNQSYKNKKTTPIVDSSLSYGEEVTKYENSRIQFDMDCQAIPSRAAMANSVTVMLDNRSDTLQKITIDYKTYNIAAYNYVLINLNKKTLPADIYINCNNRINTGEIILE